jgi:CHASE2 domain-containing sensor protein
MTIKRFFAVYWPVLPMIAVLCALVLFDLDTIGYSPFESNECNLQETSQGGLSEALYRPLTSWVFHSQPSPRVQVMTITSGSEPESILTNTCDARLFLSSLIDRLNAAHVEMIVIDKYYSSDSCGEPEKNTPFLKAMSDSIVPIVAGRPTHAPPGSDKKDSCLALSKSVDFGPHVHFGVTRLNADTHKIPLQWFVLQNDSDSTSTTTNGDSLALVAAEQADKNLTTRSDISRLLKTSQHPYGSFISLPQAIPAMQLFCAAGPDDLANKTWGSQCKSDSKNQPDLAGKIVVIGDQSEQDLQPFPEGENGQAYGVFLQAAYVEAILDSRFLKEVPLYISVTILVVWLGCVYFIFWLMKPEKAFVVSLLIYVALLLLGAMALLGFTYFIPIWMLWGAGLVLVLRYLESRGHLLGKHMHEHTFHRDKLEP